MTEDELMTKWCPQPRPEVVVQTFGYDCMGSKCSQFRSERVAPKPEYVDYGGTSIAPVLTTFDYVTHCWCGKAGKEGS